MDGTPVSLQIFYARESLGSMEGNPAWLALPCERGEGNISQT